jgi:hypothetical protein
MSESPALELDSFFLRELQTVNEDVRRLAALATFNRLRPSNNVTVEQFLAGLQAHKELWAVVGSLGIVEFAQGLAGHQAASRATESQRRSRLTEDQKASLKAAIVRVLADHPRGLSRPEVTVSIVSSGLTPAGIKRADLPIKVRQPMHELVVEGKIHTLGERHRMKYLAGLPSQTSK